MVLLLSSCIMILFSVLLCHFLCFLSWYLDHILFAFIFWRDLKERTSVLNSTNYIITFILYTFKTIFSNYGIEEQNNNFGSISTYHVFTFFLLPTTTASLWHNLLSCLLFLIQLFNDKLRMGLSSTFGMSSILLFFLITIFSFCDTEGNWDNGSKLVLFKLRTNLLKFVTKFQLCAIPTSVLRHTNTFPTMCLWPWLPFFLQVTLKYYLLRSSSLTSQTKGYLSTPLFSFLALYFPS